jgi:hypothetical protein
VPEGRYDLVVAGDDRATAVITGVPISASTRTFVNLQTAPIVPPASAMRVASGVVQTSGSAVVLQAAVRALQAVGTTTVERAARDVAA